MADTLPVIISNKGLDQAVSAWLDTKAKRTGSASTRRNYTEIITRFRQALATVNIDLDGDPKLLKLAAQGWANQRWSGDAEPVANATYNQRVAIISSCLDWLVESELIGSNPLKSIERKPVQLYAGAIPLEQDEVRQLLAKINRRTPEGLRDYVLLSIALNTGRRVAELAGLRAGHLKILNGGKKVNITWVRCKGGKVMYDDLAGDLAKVFLDYLRKIYGQIEHLPADAPIWVAFSRNESRGGAIGPRAISNIYLKRLGTGKVHTSRHTFAHEMENVGAKVSEIAARLGHTSIQTTSRYLLQMSSADNPHADALAKSFGITAEDE